jgi:hypothetical protein
MEFIQQVNHRTSGAQDVHRQNGNTGEILQTGTVPVKKNAMTAFFFSKLS